MTEKDDNQLLGRRGFLKSLVGYAGKQNSISERVTPFAETFVWADLRTGQIGFPCGVSHNDALPGSAMHIVTAAAAMESNLVSPENIFHCSGRSVVGGHDLQCPNPHGDVSLVNALAAKCAITFAHLGESCGSEALISYAREMGLADRVGRLESGVFPQTDDALPPVLLTTGMSADMRPSVAQLIRLAALIARRALPKLHSAEEQAEGPEPIAPNFKEETWEILRQGFEQSIDNAIWSQKNESQTLHPKSFTIPSRDNGKSGSFVIGFFPGDTPSYAFYASSSKQDVHTLAARYLFGEIWP